MMRKLKVCLCITPVRILMAGAMIFVSCLPSFAQTNLPLNDLSSFQNPAANWSIAGDVNADPEKNGYMKTSEGKGVLANSPVKNGSDLYTNFQHGDIDIELDYMMAKNSNSGIYLQGRYEVQLLDSWGVKNPKPSDNGGIYQRWDDNRGAGNEGYEGYAPRQNASRAPGLWQHISISFQAPRFDAAGNKIANARMLKVILNGAVVQEDVELHGPTRGAVKNDEVGFAPLRLQGDHGAVAFRNIVYKNFERPIPELTALTYKVYKGKFDKEPDLVKMLPEAQGTATLLSPSVTKRENEFLIAYKGILNVKQEGDYTFTLNAIGGTGSLHINNRKIIPMYGPGSGKINLPSGPMPFEILYSKYVSWNKPALEVTLASDGLREFLLSDATTSVEEVIDPILVEPNGNNTLRSFIDIPGSKRITHAISVASTQQLHYTYDLDRGMLALAWRGGFLDATPMWHDRGDGSSKPVGAPLYFGKADFCIKQLADEKAPWITDTTGSSFRSKGYTMDDNDLPTFHYLINGAEVTDAIRVMDNAQGLHRDLNVSNAPSSFFAKLAEGKTIETLANGMYLVDDKSYYLKIDDAEGTPIIRDADGRKQLLVPVKTKISYSILF